MPKRAAPSLTDPQARWFLDCDHDSHSYLVPADRRKEWERWIDLDQGDEASWVVPDFAIPTDGYHTVTFTLPILP